VSDAGGQARPGRGPLGSALTLNDRHASLQSAARVGVELRPLLLAS